MITKIINSGNCGAEAAALGAAFTNDVPTGGKIPKGYKTSNGLNPSLKLFNLEEVDTEKFSDVVKENIKDADGTLVFIKNVKELGKAEDFVREQAYGTAKPCLNIPTDNPLSETAVGIFIRDNKINTLHVSGRIDKKDEDTVYKMVYRYMNKVFKSYKNVL